MKYWGHNNTLECMVSGWARNISVSCWETQHPACIYSYTLWNWLHNNKLRTLRDSIETFKGDADIIYIYVNSSTWRCETISPVSGRYTNLSFRVQTCLNGIKFFIDHLWKCKTDYGTHMMFARYRKLKSMNHRGNGHGARSLSDIVIIPCAIFWLDQVVLPTRYYYWYQWENVVRNMHTCRRWESPINFIQ